MKGNAEDSSKFIAPSPPSLSLTSWLTPLLKIGDPLSIAPVLMTQKMHPGGGEFSWEPQSQYGYSVMLDVRGFNK